MGGRLTFPGGGAYHASKHAVEALSDALRFEVRGFGVRVVIVEPGLITTRFGETAAGSISMPRRRAEADDPYAAFNAAVGSATVGAYEGPLARLGGGPETVAKVIERAISSSQPEDPLQGDAPRHGWPSRSARLLPDRAWDAFMRTPVPDPAAETYAAGLDTVQPEAYLPAMCRHLTSAAYDAFQVSGISVLAQGRRRPEAGGVTLEASELREQPTP